MKRFNVLLLILISAFVLSSCDKDKGGNLLVTVKYQGKIVDQPMVYLKAGTSTNPQIPLNKYDQSGSGDAQGQVYFKNLAATTYFIYVRGYSNDIKASVQGESTVTVKERSRQDSYKITVDTK